MKQFIAMLMLLLVAGTMFPAAMADEHDTVEITTETEVETEVSDSTVTATVDASTAAEVEAMDTASGQEMRLLQLKHQIEVKAEQARKVITRLDADANVTANQTAALEDIVDELEGLTDDVDNAIAGLDGQTNQEAVEAFLAIKAEAKDLIAEFRAGVHAIVGEEEREEIRTEVRAVKAENEERVKTRIRELREEHNAVRADAALSAMGVVDAELLAQIRAGEITGEELRERLKARLSEMSEEERREAAEKIREEHTRRRVARAAVIEETKVDIRERREEMLREHLEDFKGDDVARERLEQRLEIMREGGNMSEMRVRIEERMRDGTERRVEIRERIRSDGTVERRERIREETRDDNSGSDDSDELEDESTDDNSGSDSDDDTEAEVESETEVEVRI